ncbi:MAG: hypothetical protein ACRDPT_12800 [Streptomycetales bacterium]
MTPTPEFDESTGQLRLAEETFTALLASTGPDRPSRDAAKRMSEQLDLLKACGALGRRGRVHRTLDEPLEVIHDPLCSLELSYSGKTMRGWANPATAALLLPADSEGLRPLTYLDYYLVPEALAKLVDLEPRPGNKHSTPAPYEDGMFAEERRRWSLRTTFHVTEDGLGLTSTIEVLDADGGFWYLRPDDLGVLVAWPLTPTDVWRLITRITMSHNDPSAPS